MKCARLLAFAAASGAAVSVSSVQSGCLSPPDATGTSDTPVTARGCIADASAAPPVAPGGYYTSGSTVCTASGTPHVFRGVDRPSLEWRSDGDHLAADDFRRMAGWGANVVRVALNQDFWLSGAALYDPTYAGTVHQVVAWAEAVGLDVILDLHWSDCGDLTVAMTGMQQCGYSSQQIMADTNSIEFWREVATAFKDDGHVLFELYNEPHGIAWDTWLNGGQSGRFTVVGMQQLYDTVRSTGANNVVVAGGLAYAYDLSGVGPTGAFIHGYNVMYATHPYLTSGDFQNGWESSFGHLQTTDFAPVIATEFGDGRPACTGDWDRAVIQFCEGHRASWTAWAWYPADCSFPALISDWSGTPSVQGVAVQQALAPYVVPLPPGGGQADGGGDAAGGAGDAASDGGSGPLDDGGAGSPDGAGPPDDAGSASSDDGPAASDDGGPGSQPDGASTGAPDGASSDDAAGPGALDADASDGASE